MNVKNDFKDNISKSNIRECLRMASDMNFLHLDVNQRLYRYISMGYKEQEFDRRKQMIEYLYLYRNKFYYKGFED